MAIARFEMPDGRIARFEVPDGSTPEQAQALMKAHFEPQKPVASGKTAAKVADEAGGDVAMGTIRSGLQGGTLGFSEEIGAGIAAAAAKAAQAVGATPGDKTYMEIYRQMRDSEAAKQKQFETKHPVIAGVAELAGSLPVGGAAIKGAGAAPALFELAKQGLKQG